MTIDDKKALARWAEHHKALIADVPVEDWMSQRDISRKRMRLEADPVEWVKYFFPKYAKYDFAPFHVRAIRRIVEHPERREREMCRRTRSVRREGRRRRSRSDAQAPARGVGAFAGAS